MRITPLQAAGPLLLFLLTSCGAASAVGPTQSLDAGSSALSAGEYATAAQHFESALNQAQAGSEEYGGAKLGQLQSLAHTDPDRMLVELQSLTPESGVRASDYGMILNEVMAVAKAHHKLDDKTSRDTSVKLAVEVLLLGKQRFPDFPKWDVLVQRIGDEVLSMDKAGMGALTGLGYAGSGG